MLEAGDDMVVSRRAMERFIETVPHGEFIRYSGARHELMMETDRIRRDVIDDIRRFVSSVINS